MFKNIQWFDTLSSTQTYLKEHLEIPLFNVIAAKHQTAGYGRQGAPWESQPNANLLFSFKQNTTYESSPQLWEVVLMGLIETLKVHGIVAHIKPPNDVYVDHQKIAGILVETRQESTLTAYVGVGVNVNQDTFSNHLNATSMRLLTGKEFSLEKVLTQLLKAIEDATQQDPSQRLIWYTNHIDFSRYRLRYQDSEVSHWTVREDGLLFIEKTSVHPSRLVYELIDKI